MTMAFDFNGNAVGRILYITFIQGLSKISIFIMNGFNIKVLTVEVPSCGHSLDDIKIIILFNNFLNLVLVCILYKLLYGHVSYIIYKIQNQIDVPIITVLPHYPSLSVLE